MEKSNILPLYHVDEIKFPFIEGSFWGKSKKPKAQAVLKEYLEK